MPPITPGLYEHYKGGRYRVLLLAKLEATLEDAVVYEALYENPVGRYFVRPLADFAATVEVAGQPVPRFRRLEE